MHTKAKNSGVFIFSIAVTWYSHEPAEVKFKIYRIRAYFLKLLKLFDTVVTMVSVTQTGMNRLNLINFHAKFDM